MIEINSRGFFRGVKKAFLALLFLLDINEYISSSQT